MTSLPDSFYFMPDAANTTMTKKELKELLLRSNGKIITCGRVREIKAKHIGVGIYRITLERSDS